MNARGVNQFDNRGPEDMDDSLLHPGIPEADEQAGGNSSPTSVQNSESPLYTSGSALAQQITVLPTISQSTSVLNLNPDDSVETPASEVTPAPQLLSQGPSEEIEGDPSRRESVGAQTLHSVESSDSRTGLMPEQRASEEIPDEDAPPYSEAVGQSMDGPHLSPTTSGSEHSGSSVSSPPGLSTPGTSVASSPQDPTRSPDSQSAFSNRSVRGLRGLGSLFSFGGHHASSTVQSGTQSASASASATATVNNNSSATRVPASVSNPPLSGNSRHRSSQSGGSSSTINLPLLRAVSRQRSNNTLNSGMGASSSRLNLTSPSMLSINSISAPLSHTLMRTEIRYPPGGPTAEQFKLISSREGLEKFGVPYGKDAIDHAEASRLDLPLEPPPRVFEDNAEAGSTSDEGEAQDDEGRQEVFRSRSPSRPEARSTREHAQEISSHATVPQMLVPIFM